MARARTRTTDDEWRRERLSSDAAPGDVAFNRVRGLTVLQASRAGIFEQSRSAWLLIDTRPRAPGMTNGPKPSDLFGGRTPLQTCQPLQPLGLEAGSLLSLALFAVYHPSKNGHSHLNKLSAL